MADDIPYVEPETFHKAVIFTSQPVPPYYYIDLWIDGSDTYICRHERADGESFSAEDWLAVEDYDPDRPLYQTFTYRTEEYITDFSEESITAYQESGAVPYAVYDDGTEVQVTWNQVHDISIEQEEFISDAEQLALANNQHFWSRDTATDGAGTGAFVTDEQQEAFLEAAAANFPNLGETGKTDTWIGNGSTKAFNLSEEAANTNYQVRVGNTGVATDIAKTTTGFTLTTAPADGATVYAYYTTTKKPWHNILMNVYGIAMRMGTKNLLALTKSAMAFYDGTGNEADNVTARFGANSAQIGKTSENHTIIDSRGVSSYDGQGNLAPMRASYFNELRADKLTAASAYIDSLTSEQITAANLIANIAKVANLTAEQLSAATAYIASLTANSVTANQLAADHATVNNLNANFAHVTNGVIDNAKIGHADVNGLSATYATISNLNAATGRIDTLEATDVTVNSRLTAAEANIGTLNSSKASITLLESDYITADQIDAGYMHADMSNSDVAWIQNGTIKDGAITNAMINSVSANKLTAGTIDASNITVTNLNASNITTGTINGQRIGTGSLSLDKLSDDVYTETEVDNLLATMQSEIDGAIETWTGTAVPTLSNTPASTWTSNSDKDKHVGDVYFVVNSQSQQNGYNYRFTKSGNTYSWQLIKDTDITNALSRLSTAEGSITQFSSDISQLQTSTGTLTTKTTQLETSLGDKVDVTDFNDLEDTVDGHTQTLTQHTTAISNKADSSTVTSVTNRVSKNEQDISGINTTISSLTTTVNSKADSSTVTTISNQLNTVSNTVDGHTQTIGSVQTTLDSKADSSDVTAMQTVVQQTANNVLIKATESDTTAAQGGQHIIQSLINVAPSGVKINTSKLDITGEAVFNAINNDTGTTKINGGKIDATSITLGYSQITNTPSIPTKTSDLTNDSSYATTSQIPTKTSDLTNDSSYATTSQAQGYADAKDTAIAAAAKRTYVSIRSTAVDYSANTATLEATLYIDGIATTTGVTYVWLMDGTVISGATSRNYSVPASSGLNHAYSCKCTATV